MHTNTNKRVLTLWTLGWLSCCDSGRHTMTAALQKSHCLWHIIRVRLLVTAEHKLRSHQLGRTKQLLENYRHMFSKHEGIKKMAGQRKGLKDPIKSLSECSFWFSCWNWEVWAGHIEGLVLFKKKKCLGKKNKIHLGSSDGHSLSWIQVRKMITKCFIILFLNIFI